MNPTKWPSASQTQGSAFGGYLLRILRRSSSRSLPDVFQGRVEQESDFSGATTANRPVVDLLARIGARKQATPGQVALAWLLARKPWIVPIPGTRRLDHLDENLGAVTVSLTADDMQEIESGFSQITLHGARLSEQHMAWIDC